MKILIIGCGPSTQQAIPYKNILSNHFDCIIGLNNSFIEFDDILDIHICAEYRPDGVIKRLKTGNYRKDMPRLFDEFTIRQYKLDTYNYQRIVRDHYNSLNEKGQKVGESKPDIRAYENEHGKGLFKGYGRQIVSTIICAIHAAGIEGATEIYLIGVELCFDKQQHFYSWQESICDKQKLKEPIFSQIELNGKQLWTIDIYRKSKDHIDRFIKEQCRSNGIEVYDFSNGLITKAVPLNIDEFMKCSEGELG